MSFSSSVKEEILSEQLLEKDEKLFQLYGIVRLGGNLNILSKGMISLTYNTDNPALARKIFSLTKDLYDIRLLIYTSKSSEKSKRVTYFLTTNKAEESLKILIDLEIILKKDNKIIFNQSIPKFIRENKSFKSFLSGAFIASGSISNPDKSYHLEYSLQDGIFAEEFSNFLNEIGIKSSVLEREESYVCYVKEADSISNFLNLVRAHESLFKFEDIRIKKQMRNEVNRLVNCETSNLDRTAKAAVRQKNAILYIKEKKGLESLPDDLNQLAKLRIEFPDMSMKEIGEKLDKPIGKSGVNHRFTKIEQIAEKIREEENAN